MLRWQKRSCEQRVLANLEPSQGGTAPSSLALKYTNHFLRRFEGFALFSMPIANNDECETNQCFLLFSTDLDSAYSEHPRIVVECVAAIIDYSNPSGTDLCLHV